MWVCVGVFDLEGWGETFKSFHRASFLHCRPPSFAALAVLCLSERMNSDSRGENRPPVLRIYENDISSQGQGIVKAL